MSVGEGHMRRLRHKYNTKRCKGDETDVPYGWNGQNRRLNSAGRRTHLTEF